MELELGLKITKTKDDIDSISEFQLMKDVEPVFHSRETNTVFILTANLKGYKRNNIDIKISKDGSKISISGKKPIQEMVMMGWVMQRKVVDVKGFNKVFKIPHGVNLDKIKANYNEEEWMMNIVMPKLVKGICGLKIEEFTEQEKSEIDHVSSSVGETSQKGSKDCEFQHMDGSENVIEKMLDDANKNTTQKEVRGSKLGIEEGVDDVNRNIREKEEARLSIEDSKIKDMRENDGKEKYEALKTLEDMETMLNETKKDVSEETIEKEVGNSKLRIKSGNGESAEEKDDKEEYEVTKKSERDQAVGVIISNKVEDMSKDEEFEDQKMDSRRDNKKHDDVSKDIIGGTLKEEEKEESNFRSENGKMNDIGKGFSHNIVDTSPRVFKESMIQQSGESKQKESKEYFKESGKENSMEPFEVMKVLEVEQNVVGHIPSKIGCINQDEVEESRIPQMEKTTSTKTEIKDGEHEKFPLEANQDFQKEMIKSKMKIKDGDEECVLEKLGGKEGFDDGMVIIKKEFPKHLPKSNSKEDGELNVDKMQETKNLKEEMVNKEIEYFVEKGEGERFERKHGEQKKENNTKETTWEDIEESENVRKESGQKKIAEIKGSKEFNFENEDEKDKVSKEALDENETLLVEGGDHKERTKKIRHEMEDTDEYGIVKLKGDKSVKMGENELKESGHEKFTGTEGSKGFNFANEKEQNEVINDALVEDECLIMEGGEYKDKSKEIVQVEKGKNRHGKVKLKGEGSTKIHGEPNEPFEGENVNNGLFDGRKTQKFQEIEQTEDVDEKDANVEKFMKKVSRDKYEKAQNEKDEGFDKNKTKKKDKRFLQEETSKGISKASNAAKEVFPMKMLDSPVDTREGLENTRIEKIKDAKESVKDSSMEPFEAMKVSKLEPCEVNDDDHKNFIEPKRETKDDDPNGENYNKEGFDGKITINEEFSKKIPKRSHEESEGLNVLKMQETKDVKRKGKEIEYLKEEDEGDRLKRMDVEEMEVNNIRKTMQEEIENNENGIRGGGHREVTEIEGIKGLNVAKEGEEESKERSKEIEQDEAGVSHNIVDSSQRVFEEALIQQSEESKQKKVGGSKCDSNERLKQVSKESSKEQNELREPKVPQMEKAKRTKGRKNGGMDSEKKPFEVNEDVQKVVFGDAIQKEVVKMNEEFPKNLPKKSFDESEGLNVQKIQESKNVKEEMVDKEVEYFEEKGEGERFKRMHVETKKGNTRETRQEEIEKSDNEIKESGQHVKEKNIEETDEVSKSVNGELQQKVAEIDESKGFNIGKKEEKKQVTKKSFVESESLMEKKEEKESKERNNAKRVQDEDDKIEFGIVKLKGEGPATIHVNGGSFQEKEESKDVNEKGEKTEKFGKKVNNDIQNEEDEDFKNGVKKEKYECHLSDDVSERKSQDTKDAKEDIPMKILDSQNDTREKLKDRKIEKIKGREENEKDVPFVKKVKFEEEEFMKRTNAIVVDEEATNDVGIVKLKGEGSTNITHKFQEKEEIDEDVNKKSEKSEEFVKKVNEKIQNEEDEGFKKNTTKENDECVLQEEMSKGRSKASKAANEPFDDRTEKEIRNHKLESIEELIDKENVGIGIVDERKMQKFQEINQTQDGNKRVANSEKTTKKMNGNKEVSEKDEQVEANEDLRNDIEERNFGESMTKEELQEFEMERIRTPEREFQSVVSMGFKEFDYKNGKNKKKKTKVLDTKFESKERYESTDESTNQEVFSPKKPKVGENCTRNELCTNEVETMEDQVINPISVPRFQSEVEEKDIENLIEMKGKDEFHNGEEVGDTMLEKTDEPEKKINYREQENAARYDGKLETKEKDMFKEFKTTRNVHDEKNKIHETKKTAQKKEPSVKFEVDEKGDESSDERLKNDVAEMKAKRDYEEHEYGVEEINAPKTVACEGAKPSRLQSKMINQQSKDEIDRKSECVIEEHEATKEFSPKNVEKGKVVKKREGLKVVDSEETKDDSTLATIQTTEEKKPKRKEKTSQLDMASGSKSVAEKVRETLKREDQRKSEESPAIVERKEAHELTIAPNMNNEIPKVEEVQKEKEVEERYNNEPDATVSKEGIQVTTTHSKEKQRVEPRGEVDKLQDEQIGQIVEKYINKDEQAKHRIDEQKESKDETSGGKKDNAKISKTVEEEKILKRREESKVAKSEEEMKPKMVETTPQFDLASGSKKVSEKVHEHQRHSEATISKEDAAQAKATHSKQKMVQQSMVPNSLNTQQLEDEGEELEQCINKDEEQNHEIEEIEEEKDNEKVHEEHKGDKDETGEGKKDSVKTSKNLFVPLVIAGSTFFAATAFIFVRHRRSKKM